MQIFVVHALAPPSPVVVVPPLSGSVMGGNMKGGAASSPAGGAVLSSPVVASSPTTPASSEPTVPPLLPLPLPLPPLLPPEDDPEQFVQLPPVGWPPPLLDPCVVPELEPRPPLVDGSEVAQPAAPRIVSMLTIRIVWGTPPRFRRSRFTTAMLTEPETSRYLSPVQ